MNKVEKTIVKTESGMRRFAIHINLPRKKVFFSTPAFFIEPKSSRDLGFICDWISNPKLKNNCFQGLVLPYNKVRRILLPYKSRAIQKTLMGNSKEETFKNLINSKVVIIDPLTEGAYYKLGLIESDLWGLPEEFIEQTKRINESNKISKNKRIDKIKLYREHLYEISNKLQNFTLKFLSQLKLNGSDILLAPSNLIIPEIPESIDLSIKINEETHKICENEEGWIPAAYFVIKTSVLEDFEAFQKILNYIDKEKPTMIFFKIVDSYGLDSRNAAIQRDNLKIFLKGLAHVSQQFNIPSFFLNVDSLGLFLIQSRIDGFCTPSNGIVEPTFVSYKNTDLPDYQRGKYFLVPKLSLVSMRALEKIYNTKGKTFPCPYSCCEDFDNKRFKTFIGIYKQKLIRIHYYNSIDNLVLEAHKAINDGTVRAAFNKLANSSCSHYLEILPDFN